MTRSDIIPATMRALLVSSLDGPEAMRVVEARVPRPGLGEVLVRVTAAGVNFTDTMQTRGIDPFGPAAPYLAGTEAVGRIVALGAAVEGWQVGARVLGGCSAAFAGYVVLPAALLVPVPEGWTDTQAVGLHTNWMTAHAALRTFGALREGETVLVHAAAGGVGPAR
jgi:NADPH:quinone reductase